MIGIIADDVTGGTDAASACRDGGLRTVLTFGVPRPGRPMPHVDAHVVALKSRTQLVADAVEDSLRAMRSLIEQGADTIYVKYCSTFDSTPSGNIGPVVEALAEELGAGAVVATPASPRHGRTVYRGHLFVGDVLLSDSHMRDHPLTPMRDASVVRLLAVQSGSAVERIDLSVVRSGPEAIARADARATRHLVADATDDDDLLRLARASRGRRLLAGSAGLVGAIARDRAGKLLGAQSVRLPDRAAVLAGSCSVATLAQVEVFVDSGHPRFDLDVAGEPDADRLAALALRWFDDKRAPGPVLISSSRSPADLAGVHAALGAERAAGIVERAIGLIAAGLVERGIRRFVSAGGETSGAVVDALKLSTGLIGREAAAGVPWIHIDGDRPMAVLLKSGNFGDPELLVRAATQEVS